MREYTQPRIGFCLLAGALAGFVNGFFGAGGGMVLVPLLIWLCRLEDKAAFSSAIAVILPLIFLLNLVIPERIFQAVLLMMLLAVGTCFILNFRIQRCKICTKATNSNYNMFVFFRIFFRLP